MLVKSVDVGEILSAGTTVVTIGDIDHPWLRGYVNETDLAKVKVGSKAKVTTDSYKGRVFEGRVTFISAEAGIHAQADPDRAGARETGVSHQDRTGQLTARVEIQHAGRRGNPAGIVMQPIIETHDLTRRFGTLTAVDHLNLSVAKGEIFGLVGPDGAGKTTTLRMLCGLMDPTEGSATVAGHDVARESQAVKDQIGYMAQRFRSVWRSHGGREHGVLRRPLRHCGE